MRKITDVQGSVDARTVRFVLDGSTNLDVSVDSLRLNIPKLAAISQRTSADMLQTGMPITGLRSEPAHGDRIVLHLADAAGLIHTYTMSRELAGLLVRSLSETLAVEPPKAN